MENSQQAESSSHRFNLDFPSASTSIRPRALMRKYNEDFKVTETLSFEPSGEGEHLFLLIEKNGCNTDWLSKQLARHFNVKPFSVGYAGKKDRYSQSQQWFSIHLPGVKAFDLPEANESFKILKTEKHNKKLRLGSIARNNFEIILRDVTQPFDQQVYEKIGSQGFPNYFAYQRFGFDGENLIAAEKMFNKTLKVKNRNLKGIYYSAARSYLFNLQLAERVRRQDWDQAIAGDCLMFDNSHAYFAAGEIDSDVIKRIEQGAIHPSGWLAGGQNSESRDLALKIEQTQLIDYSNWIDALTVVKMDSARRAYRVIPKQLSVSQQSDSIIKISFSLPSGAYATALLRELFEINDVARQPDER
ncbi:MAG: tRNA pseudouridine(13) synthase TruD [Gammaproteobacteria bacterium]|nr:tRNA pseudouridine(13) synthase TruD [Gammaproteobacteria bacterium]MDH5629812.1 tRNA pseudouridine(13) synthase TruD [Gammaproteobacteria bacterium]